MKLLRIDSDLLTISRSKSKSDAHVSPSATTPTTQTSSLSTSSTRASLAAGAAYTPLAPDAVSLIDNSCPGTPTFPSFNGDSYNCTHDKGRAGYTYSDVSATTAYTLRQCIDACSMLNVVSGKKTCKAIVLDGNMATSYAKPKGANCWLKEVSTTPYFGTGLTLAVLQT
jgi:hypothetical protein